MSHLAPEHAYDRASNELYSAHHWVDANQGRDGQGPPTSPTSSKSAAMHWTNYRSVRGIPANLTHTFPLVGHGSGFGSPVPTQDPTRRHQHPPVTPQGKTGPPRSSKVDSKNAKEQLRKDVARSRVEEQDTGPVYIRNQKKDLAVLAANSGTNFLGYHTLAKDRTPEAVFMAPPEPYQAIPEYTTSNPTVYSGRLDRGAVRRIPKAIEPGETLVMLFDDGPRVVQAIQRAPYLIYSLRARWTIIGSWNERKYAIVDPSSEIAFQGRQWYRFVQPSEMQANDVRPLMQSCLERKGWEFVDARPPGWHIKRRENEVPFLEMIMNTEIDWDVTEWMVGVTGYGE